MDTHRREDLYGSTTSKLARLELDIQFELPYWLTLCPFPGLTIAWLYLLVFTALSYPFHFSVKIYLPFLFHYS